MSRPSRQPDRLPLAILMSGTGSNARRLLEQPDPRYEVRLLLTDNPASNAARIAAEFGVEYAELDIYRFCGALRPGAPAGAEGAAGAGAAAGTRAQAGAAGAGAAGAGAAAGTRAQAGAAGAGAAGAGADPACVQEAQRRLREGGYARAAFDRELAAALRRCGARLAALAGYDWVLGPELCREFLFVNVHPGDLRARDDSGRRLYVGLAWVPTAKAILNGERFVRSSTHLVTATLDGGPIARVSRPVPVELPEGTIADNILPPGVNLGEIIRDLRSGGGRFGQEPIVRISRQAQERLKVEGDWVEFPRTVQALAGLLLEGRLVQAPDGAAILDGEPVTDLFLQPEGVA